MQDQYNVYVKKKYTSTPKTDFKKTFRFFTKGKYFVCPCVHVCVRASQVLHLTKNTADAKPYF